jgi:hypothetical protein
MISASLWIATMLTCSLRSLGPFEFNVHRIYPGEGFRIGWVGLLQVDAESNDSAGK